MGDVIADAMLEASTPTDFGGAVAAFMNSGRRPTRAPLRETAGSRPGGQVTLLGGVHRPAVRNTLVVKTCSGQAIYNVLDQQFNNPNAGCEPDHARFRQRPLPVDDRRSVPHVVPGSVTFNGTPVAARHELPRRHEQLHGRRRRRVHGLPRSSAPSPLGGSVDLDAFAAYLSTATRPWLRRRRRASRSFPEAPFLLVPGLSARNQKGTDSRVLSVGDLLAILPARPWPTNRPKAPLCPLWKSPSSRTASGSPAPTES